MKTAIPRNPKRGVFLRKGWHKFGCCLVAGVALGASAATLEVNQVRQRYPWNGLVDIDYTIAWGAGEKPGLDDNLEVLMVDKSVSPVVTNKANCFLQAPLPLTEGSHRITWDANYDGVKVYSPHAEFIVKIAHYAEAYMVIDVSTGSKSDAIYKVVFLNGAPQGGFNTGEYKGDKIVLRRIRPGSYIAGSPEDEANRNDANEKRHRVAISRPFYIGVFEITQQQYYNVMGSNPAKYKGDEWQYRPVEQAVWNTVRGGTWPNGKPASNSFMDKLIQKCKSKDFSTGEYSVGVEGFDLPTEFQWEYACRAGTTKAFNTTNDFDNASSSEHEKQMMLLGRYKDNGGTAEMHTAVGSYLPNAWGLYDMHGNVWEWCLDWFADPTALNPKQYKDPVGAASGSYRVQRGGAFGEGAGNCRSASRNCNSPITVGENRGFRLFWSAPQ